MFIIFYNNEYVEKDEKIIKDLYSSNKLTNSNNINCNIVKKNIFRNLISLYLFFIIFL